MAGNVDFTPTEIKRQAGRVREQVEAYKKTSKGITDIFEKIANIGFIPGGRHGGDPYGIIGKTRYYIDSYERLTNDIEYKFAKLADIMEKWASSSTSNEEQTSVSIDELSKKVDEIYEMLESLNKA